MQLNRFPLILVTALTWNAAANISETNAQATQAGVLCQWAIEMNIQATGEHCFSGHDQAFQDAVKDSINRIDAFIIKNEPTTPEKLAARKQAARKLFEKPGLCSPTAIQFYERFKSASLKQIRSGTATLLAIPRKPTMEPCL